MLAPLAASALPGAGRMSCRACRSRNWLRRQGPRLLRRSRSAIRSLSVRKSGEHRAWSPDHGAEALEAGQALSSCLGLVEGGSRAATRCRTCLPASRASMVRRWCLGTITEMPTASMSGVGEHLPVVVVCLARAEPGGGLPGGLLVGGADGDQLYVVQGLEGRQVGARRPAVCGIGAYEADSKLV